MLEGLKNLVGKILIRFPLTTCTVLNGKNTWNTVDFIEISRLTSVIEFSPLLKKQYFEIVA